MVDAGLIDITAFISPFQSDRDKVKNLIGNKILGSFVEITIQNLISGKIITYIH